MLGDAFNLGACNSLKPRAKTAAIPIELLDALPFREHGEEIPQTGPFPHYLELLPLSPQKKESMHDTGTLHHGGHTQPLLLQKVGLPRFSLGDPALQADKSLPFEKKSSCNNHNRRTPAQTQQPLGQISGSPHILI